MGALAIAVPYVIFVWWFSTGAVLLLVGLTSRHRGLLKLGSLALFASSLFGIIASSRDVGAASTYCAFTCAILLWGAVETSLLSGWITGQCISVDGGHTLRRGPNLTPLMEMVLGPAAHPS